jgi:hypothetical protein
MPSSNQYVSGKKKPSALVAFGPSVASTTGSLAACWNASAEQTPHSARRLAISKRFQPSGIVILTGAEP